MGSRVLYLQPWALNDPVKSSFQGKEQKKVPWAVEYQNPGLSWIYPLGLRYFYKEFSME
jgi:hypothetical protein